MKHSDGQQSFQPKVSNGNKPEVNVWFPCSGQEEKLQALLSSFPVLFVCLCSQVCCLMPWKMEMKFLLHSFLLYTLTGANDRSENRTPCLQAAFPQHLLLPPSMYGTFSLESAWCFSSLLKDKELRVLLPFCSTKKDLKTLHFQRQPLLFSVFSRSLEWESSDIIIPVIHVHAISRFFL